VKGLLTNYDVSALKFNSLLLGIDVYGCYSVYFIFYLNEIVGVAFNDDGNEKKMFLMFYAGCKFYSELLVWDIYGKGRNF